MQRKLKTIAPPAQLGASLPSSVSRVPPVPRAPRVRIRQRGTAIARLDPRVRELERQLARCATQISRLQLLAAENAELKKRMRKLRQLKSSAEEGLLTLRSRQKAATRIMALQIKDHGKYAASCLQLYEVTLATLQRLVKTTHAGQRFVDHKCPDCGPRPIHEFGVRMLPSGQLGFNPYCIECTKVRKARSRRVVDMEVKEVAAEFAQRTPKVARQMVDRFEEEVEDLMEQEASKNSTKS